MPIERFDIIFSGQLMPGQDATKAKEGVRRLFKASDAQLQRLFSGKPASIKKAVDLETASKYRTAFRNVGALVDIRPSEPPPQDPIKPEPAADAQTEDFSLAPANSGSLEEFAPQITPAPLPDISAIDLSAPGTDMDDSPAPPPAHIDTDQLELVAGNDWTLEDCQPADLPLVMPELDDLSLAAPDDTSHIPPDPPAPPLPDISKLTLDEIEPPHEDESTPQ